MKCGNCPALRTEGYEYPESYCLLGAESTREYADGWSGCYRKPESIRKLVAKIEEAMDHQYDGIDEWVTKEEIQERAMREAFDEEIHDYRHGSLYLCFKDEGDGRYYPIGCDRGDGIAPGEILGLLRLVFLEKVRKYEREAYHREVPDENKKKGRKKRPHEQGFRDYDDMDMWEG